MNQLEDLSQRIDDRLVSVQRMLDMTRIVLPQSKMKKLGQELFAIERLLEESENAVSRQRDHLHQLKTLEQSSQKYLHDLQHLQDHIPEHLPKKIKAQENVLEPVTSQTNTEANQPPEKVKKLRKRYIKEMESITMPEYESIPPYMRGRVTYDRLNAAVRCINAAVSAKYKIVHQSVKTLNNHTRKLQQRFKEQETKDSKGQFFVVDDDICEFTETKVDKRFQWILSMLRHCQRLKELRGGGLTRYVLL